MAILSFSPSSSAFCHGVSMSGMMNLMSDPCSKHCQAVDGHECDQIRGDSKGDEGTGDELSAAAIDLATLVGNSLMSKEVDNKMTMIL